MDELEKMLASYDRNECVKALGKVADRIEYLDRLELGFKAGFSDN